jgi:N-acetylglucosaminyldiphosphoundecaprenol N-acetyl-beta-D-mannosaminyltransferase
MRRSRDSQQAYFVLNMRTDAEPSLMENAARAQAPEAPEDTRFTLLDCPIDNLSMKEVLERIEGFIHSRTPHQHIAINVHKFVQAYQDPKLHEVVQQCHLSCADGQPVIWLSQLMGRPLKLRITGIDLMMQLLTVAANKNYRVYFLGAHHAVVSAVVERCQDHYPRLQVAGYRDGYWKPDEEPEVVEAIRQARPDILFVALGSPQKEFFIHQHLHHLQVPFAMAVGGSFDILAGRTKRAPEWIQRNGLEWFWRVLQEPRRMWWRYCRDGLVFTYLVLREFLRRLQ